MAVASPPPNALGTMPLDGSGPGRALNAAVNVQTAVWWRLGQ